MFKWLARVNWPFLFGLIFGVLFWTWVTLRIAHVHIFFGIPLG